MRILIVEDEKQLIEGIKKYLIEKGYAIDTAFDGEEGEYLAETEPYDVIILDLMLPGEDGITICKNLRKKNIKIPILMLTAKGSVDDRVIGLNAGADDYLVKPFDLEELGARIESLIRRSQSAGLTILQIKDLVLDPIKHTVFRAKKEVKLTPKEFSILEMLMRRSGQVVTRTMLMEHVWDYDFESVSNVVDVFVATVRKKVGKDLVKTIHGVGYKIE